MADQNQSSGAGKGRGRAGDQTAQPGQALGQLPFGIQSTVDTGLPGTSTGNTGPSDPTTVPGQVPPTVFGQESGLGSTGVDGSQGATQGVAGGASYTDPFAMLSGGEKGDATGGSTDSEANANKYGSSSMVGIQGTGQPKSTGVGEGTLLIGGNHVGG